MSNYRKSFNFRNGVQVDDDNFIINANGLVGIGTSIPTELLDVCGGTVKVTGIITSTSFFTENSTIGNLNVEKGINASGIITGSVFSGSASGLTDIYAIAVDGWYITGETISTSLRTGIGITNPTYQFQVGNDPVNTDFEGLAIDINGNLYSSGDLSFSNANASGLTTTKDLIVTGVSTSGSLNVLGLTTTKDLIVTGVSTSGSLNVSGLTTTKDLVVTGVSTSGSLNVLGLTTTKNLIVTGVSTISDLTVSGFTTTKDLVVTGISSLNDTSIVSLEIGNSNAGFTSTNNLYVSGISTFIGLSTFKNVQVEDAISVYGDSLLIGLSTVNNILHVRNFLGIGTALPTNNSLHLRKNDDAILQITSDTVDSKIILGNSIDEQGNNGVIRFGNTNSLYPYSTPDSIDIINYGAGNFVFYLEGESETDNGSFYWNKKSTINLLTLTSDGNLGIGKTNPTTPLDVVGIITSSGDVFIGNNLHVANNSQFSGPVTIDNDLAVNSINVTETFNGDLVGNVNSVSGVSTFYSIKLDENIAAMGQLAVNGFLLETLPQYPDIQLAVNATPETLFAVDGVGRVSIGSTDFPFDGINVLDRFSGFAGLVIGTDRIYESACTVDFTYAGRRGRTSDGTNPFETREYMRVPCVTTTERNNFIGLIGGEIIYNLTTNKHQGYDGNSWNDLY